MGRPKETIKDKFWKYVTPCEGCWEWKASINWAGYGLLTHEKKHIKAHRISWELHNGEIPKGLYVRHSCDNPKCVNPDHLSLGTQVENMRDAKERNRIPKGIAHHASKLTEADVKQICEMYDAGMGPAKIYKTLSLPVNYQAVWKVCKRIRWEHVQ